MFIGNVCDQFVGRDHTAAWLVNRAYRQIESGTYRVLVGTKYD